MALRKEEYLPHYTYEDYKNWEGNWELINGIPYAMSPAPNIYHQQINLKLGAALLSALKNCKTCLPSLPIDWKINEDTVVQPDISIICFPFGNGTFISQAPSVIFEILSPASAQKDQTLKYEIYESQGVKYYIIVNPIKKIVEIFELVDGKYVKIKETAEETFDFVLEECSFSLNFKEIW